MLHRTLRRSIVRGGWALLALAWPVLAGAAGPSACSGLSTNRMLPDARLCRSRLLPAANGAPAEVVAALLANAGEAMHGARDAVAERLLDCADAAVEGTGSGADALRAAVSRQRGVLDYRRERLPQALRRFECAAAWSRAANDADGTARALNNLGSAQRRIGDFRAALGSLTESLALRRAQGGATNAVLNNIADVYRALGEGGSALRYYQQALQATRATGDDIEAAHVLESMADVTLDAGHPAQAAAWLRQALQEYQQAGNRVYALRVHDGLIRVALAQGDVDDARRWQEAALALADSWTLPLPAALQLQVARVQRTEGRLPQARMQLESALAALADRDPVEVDLLKELAAVQGASGEVTAANATLERANERALAQARAQHDQRLDWMRVRFEAEEDRRLQASTTSSHWVAAGPVAALLAMTLAVVVAFALRRRRRLQRAPSRPRTADPPLPAASPPSTSPALSPPPAPARADPQAFRSELVALMLASVESWERCTGSSRLELAERSRLWRVNVDDGRLRARALERYLSVARLPRQPRWRSVVRTAYYVLAQCPALDAASRQQLQAGVDGVLAHSRSTALQAQTDA
ncbi:tetratricopeptide repeat protein [Stenotrophomonas sp. Sa5BUN4]|uniref:Tetratricopeptide repeat protein n=1 Tax=Stenotrophomonas lacuserhaii TaxID=2760084 RepID=A0A8X8K5F1_9GAMM|nr:tetratricopeptide repeat protein [Stenotrophomonas pennii]MBD7954701.1 tetratricopeptide repeat protein [Stenotrophomonas pennii]